MKNSSSGTLRRVGLVLFVIGALIGLAIGVSSFMADMEAVYYGFDELSQGRFSTLRCPTLLTFNETGNLQATVSNPLDRPIEPVVRADISSPTLPESTRTQIRLQPGQSQSLNWTVDRTNVDLRNFIFAKVYIYPVYPLALREATCGILVLNLPYLSSSQWLILGIIASIVGLVAGLVLWIRGNQPLSGRTQERSYAMITLAILIGVAMLCGLMGWWLLGWIVLVVCALLLAAMLFLLL